MIEALPIARKISGTKGDTSKSKIYLQLKADKSKLPATANFIRRLKPNLLSSQNISLACRHSINQANLNYFAK